MTSMRLGAAFMLACTALYAAAAWPTDASNDSPPIHLRGYYRLYERYSVWRLSDASPWYILDNARWADRRLVKWGYVPVMHDGERYYCMVDHDAPTGSRIPIWMFSCGDPATVELLYNSNRPPLGLRYGGPY